MKLINRYSAVVCGSIILVAATEMYLCGSFYSCHFLFLYNNFLSSCPSFHINLICLISIFFSHISLFCFLYLSYPSLLLCHSPHFLPIAFVFLASSTPLYTTKSLAHKHLSDFFDCNIVPQGASIVCCSGRQ